MSGDNMNKERKGKKSDPMNSDDLILVSKKKKLIMAFIINNRSRQEQLIWLANPRPGGSKGQRTKHAKVHCFQAPSLKLSLLHLLACMSGSEIQVTSFSVLFSTVLLPSKKNKPWISVSNV